MEPETTTEESTRPDTHPPHDEVVDAAQAQAAAELAALAALAAQAAAQDEAPTEAEQAAAEEAARAAASQALAEAHLAETAALQGKLDDAVARYRALLLSHAPEVPAEFVEGATIDELEASYARASALVAQLRREAAERVAQERVPAGAPTRRAPDASSLTPQQKIVLGLQGTR